MPNYAFIYRVYARSKVVIDFSFMISVNRYKSTWVALTLSCLPIYPMPSLKVFYQNMDYYNELNIYQKVLNEFRLNFAETW